ncbi:MAG: hypothetical protein IJF39_00360 [Clostridia bacterium]|nr:hypothetical protein [Clostridia bacterium]
MRFRNWLALLFCGTLCGGVLLFCGFLRNPCGRLTGGVETQREYYLYNPSSQAKIAGSLSFAEYFSLVGEKYTLRFPSAEAANAYAENLLAEKGAQTLFEERVAGVRSIYAYTVDGREGVQLFGARVNLHLAICGEEVQVGTPIIFGGY